MKRKSMINEFEGGVKYYTFGTIKMEIGFPEDKICCRWCRFCRDEKTVDRHWCRLTNDILYNISLRGDKCPIKFKEKNNE